MKIFRLRMSSEFSLQFSRIPPCLLPTLPLSLTGKVFPQQIAGAGSRVLRSLLLVGYCLVLCAPAMGGTAAAKLSGNLGWFP